MKNLDEIIESNMTVNEKLNAIRELINACKEFANKLQEQHVYCKRCDEFYKPTAFQEEIKLEEHRVCTYWPLAEFEDPKYENKMCRIKYRTCPCGHITSENMDYRF